jgi:deoxyribodipyrimidine photo-lyase
VFNPYRQSEKFDPQAIYIKRWITELKDVPAKACHNMPGCAGDLFDINNYHPPIVDINTSRQETLALYRSHMSHR